ncbi:MAG: SGNH/GDSL hydrolase family protein [Lentisphaeria bacterium]|nr:SGNH/GDSL hydrolase family protein [Lentisphaeria bacterium]
MKKISGVLLAAFAAVVLSAAETKWEDFSNASQWKVGREAITQKAGESLITFEGPGKIYTKTFRAFPAVNADVNKKFTGVAFKVKGDGSGQWTCITFIAGPMYCATYYFPLTKGVTEYRVAFADMAPSKDTAYVAPAVFTAGSFSAVSTGDYWKISHNNYPRPAYSYQLMDLRLLDDIQPQMTPGKFQPAKLDGVIAKMKAGQPVKILCFGDSITAGTGLRDRENDRYATILQGMLREHYKNDKIVVQSVAVGGAHTFQSIGWLDRDLEKGGMPDAATMLIGFNNRSACQTKEFYAAHLEQWIDRFAYKTAGKAAVVLIPAVQGVPRFYDQQDMADAVREIAAKRGLQVAPIDEAIAEIGPVKHKAEYLGDAIHPNPAGHKLFAEVLFKTFAK